MELYYGIGAIAGICVLVLLIGVMKQKAQAVFIFALRCIAGSVGISVVNELLKSQGIAVSAGINPASVLTVGVLGICGFALIYGILFYKFL